MLNFNTENTNVILGRQCETLWGKSYIEDYIGDIKYQISPLSFFQVNPRQTEKLYGKALEYAGLTGNETVWDLYCGIGTISLFLAKNARKVYGVEIVPQAIEDAKNNAAINGIDNAEFFVGKAEEVVPHFYVVSVKMPITRDGTKSYVLAVMQKDMTLPPYYAELGHAIPSGLSLSLENKVKGCVKNALIALGVNHGSVNMDLLINSNGQVHIVDIGARMGGNLIGSHIIPTGTGIDYMGNMIKAAVGDETNWTPATSPQPVATKLLALKPGIVKVLPDFVKIETEFNVIVEHHLHVGDSITPYRTNLDGCGYVVAKASTIEHSIELAAKVRQMLDITILRK